MIINNRFPAVYLNAKLKLIDKRIGELPDVRLGHHEGRAVLRQCLYDQGKRCVREYSANNEKGKLLYSQSEYRKKLSEVKRQLEIILKNMPKLPGIDLKKVDTIYNKDMWERIHIRAEFEEKTTGYQYKDMMMDSRGEMIVAQTLESLGLEYKYEPRIIIGDEIYYPDFIVYLPEFERCFFIEFMGRLDNDKYISRNKFKLMDYLKAGMVINKDILLFCGYEDSMVNADDMIDDIVALIKKYCRMYSETVIAS
jgi:hypothetical protein